MMKFKYLNKTEHAEFTEYAQETDPPEIEDWSLYHPICRAVWRERGFKPQKCEFQYEGATIIGKI